MLHRRGGPLNRNCRLFVSAGMCLAACGQPDQPEIGQVCNLEAARPALDEIVVVTHARDCETGLCARMPVEAGKELPTDFRPLRAEVGTCTAACESDGDCVAAGSSPCASGFTCGVRLTVGASCCQKLCLCRDYVVTLTTGQLATPAACDPGNLANSCCNLEGRRGHYPNCPR